MAVRGTKPKPTKLRLIEGNPGKRPINPNEPRADGRPVPPLPLAGRAAALWAQYVAPAAWLAEADSPTAYLWVHLQAQFETDPAAMLSARIGQLRALASSLGFDPSSRARMGTPAPAVDPVAHYFN